MFTLIRIFMGGFRIWRRMSDDNQPERPIFRDGTGKVIAIGGSDVLASGVLTGHGTQTTPEQKLLVGMYKVEFYFPATTRLLVIGANGEHLLVIHKDVGMQYLSIDTAGAYTFRVEPSDEEAAWRITYHKMGSG